MTEVCEAVPTAPLLFQRTLRSIRLQIISRSGMSLFKEKVSNLNLTNGFRGRPTPVPQTLQSTPRQGEKRDGLALVCDPA